MLIRYKCLVCGSALTSPAEAAGRFVECPDCGTESTVPPPKSVAPPRKGAPPPRVADADGDDPLDAARHERVAQARMRTQLVLLFGGFAATAAVVVIAVLAFQNKQQRRALEVAAAENVTKAEPKPAPDPKPAPRPRVPAPPRPTPGPALKDITETEEGVVLPERPVPVQPVSGPRKKSPLFDAPLPFVPDDNAPTVAPAPKPVAAQPPAKAKDAAAPKVDNPELAKLAKNLKSHDPKVRLKAVESAGKLGDAAKPVTTELCDLIQDANGPVAAAALVALETVRPDLYKPLAKVVLDRDEKVQLLGLQQLTALGRQASPTARLLHSGLRRRLDESTASPYALSPQIYEALKAMGADDAETLSLMRAIATPGGVKTILGGFGKKPTASANHHRYAALDYLASWAGKDEIRRRAVIPLVVSGFDNDVTILGCIALVGQYGRLSKDVLPTLKQLKLSGTASVREAATKAVDAIEADIARKE